MGLSPHGTRRLSSANHLHTASHSQITALYRGLEFDQSSSIPQAQPKGGGHAADLSHSSPPPVPWIALSTADVLGELCADHITDNMKPFEPLLQELQVCDYSTAY